MRIVVDCCLPRDWKPFLEAAFHAALLWTEIGAPDSSDMEIMLWAAANNAVVLTQDRDFGEILAMNKLTAPSVIQIRDESPAPEDVGQQVLTVLAGYVAELEAGAIASIYAGRSRLSLLPLT